jgi:hypothetical protein
MSTGDRTAPAHALRYLVRSYGVPIAWVTLDGRVHWADDLDIGAVAPHMPRFRTMLRHRDAVLARWPQRFALNDEDGEVSSRPAV